jgi:hypothetical protein
MKLNHTPGTENGTVLIISITTITILTLICATSLYVMSQNANSGMQTASWQQALSGAESAIDRGIVALNTNSWTGWKTVTSGSLPSTKPSGGSSASGAPGTGQYNYMILPTVISQGEGNNTVSSWAVMDTAGTALLRTIDPSNPSQWYRVRATGVAAAPGPARVSNQKLDNDLRMISLRFDRKSGTAVTTPQASRTVEVVLQALPENIWTRGIMMKNEVTMTGGGTIDSFDSSNPLKSSTNPLTLGQFDASKRQSHGDVGILNSTGSDLGDTYVYGSVSYSGPAIKKTENVQGTVSTPFNAAIPNTGDPNWAAGTYTTYPPGFAGPFTASSIDSTNPTRIMVSGDFRTAGGQTFSVKAPLGVTAQTYIVIWVAGKFVTTGNGVVSQDKTVHATWYVDDDIDTGGDSYQNKSGYASNVSFIGVGNNFQVKVSGGGNFSGTIDAPGFDIKVTGTGDYSGAIIGNTLTINGGGSLHYDESLGAGLGSMAFGKYAFASWFEDNSAPARGVTY